MRNPLHFSGIDFSKQTLKLTGTYLLIIMTMSIGFSYILYQTSAREIDRPFRPSRMQEMLIEIDPDGLDRLFTSRRNEAYDSLLKSLLLLNFYSLVVGSVLSYMLARWSLRPIEESVELQNQFISDASHELRTPLTVLLTSNEVALRKKKLTSDQIKSILAENVDEVKKLQVLSNSLLELLRDDTSNVTLSSISLKEVVNQVVKTLLDHASEKQITLKNYVTDVDVMSESTRLQQIITVLVENAIKYSRESSKVTISVKKHTKKVILSISDNGIGISEEDLPHIFERFYRAEKSRTKNVTNGYGLGLSIAARVADQIRATISVESKLGQGSTFSITIPTGLK